jgi:transcriptional regulator of acetoin/glycerol metabolism
MVIEQMHISDDMDKKGLKTGDSIHIAPISGRKSSFKLNRTCVDFISACNKDRVEAFTSVKLLGTMAKESFHVQVRKEQTKGRLEQKKERFMIRVVDGGPVKLNGNYVLEAYLEQGDVCEIGYNKIEFEPNLGSLGFDPQQKLIKQNLRMIESNLPILIEGETGVGKTCLALKIHEQSGKQGRFVHLNISSFAHNIIESELFGHVRGAFTGAMNDKKGALKEAEGGTLFIDEIDSLPIEIQTKLLIFLDSYRFRPVGSSIEQKARTRLIFSSGQDLLSMVMKKSMRKDFYFRISCGEVIKLDSLRDRPELIEKYCQLFSIENCVSLNPKLIDFYKSLPWPGNYRQLKGHLCKKKVLGSSTKLSFDSADEKLIQNSSDLCELHKGLDIQSLQSIKVAYAKRVYYQAGCNYTLAAAKLEISAKSLKTLIRDKLDYG